MNAFLTKTNVVAVFAAVLLSSFAVLVQAAERREQTYTKTSQRSVSKTAVTLGDVPNHELTQEVMVQSMAYSDRDFGDTETWSYNHVDQIDGNGSHRPDRRTHRAARASLPARA